LGNNYGNMIPMSINSLSPQMSAMQVISSSDVDDSSKKGLIRMQKDKIKFEKYNDDNKQKVEAGRSLIPMSGNMIKI